MDKVVTSERVLLDGDFKGHVGSNMGGFGEVHVGFWDQANKGWRDQTVGMGSWKMAVLDEYLFQENKKLAYNIQIG